MTRWTRTLAAAAVLVAAAAAAPAAWAHARLVSTTPGEGAVVASAPRQVTIRFDDAIRALGGTTVVENSDKRPVTAGKARAHGRVLAVPLRRLRDGDYTVRWRVLSDDGHTIEGVFAFAVGAGRAPPSTALTTGGTHLTREVISRWLFFAGLLVAVGVALFLLLAWSPALRAAAGAAGDEGALWPLAFGGFFLAFLGASSLIPHHGVSTTRFGLAYAIGGIVAIVGATLSAIALADRRFGRGAVVCGLALLPVPSVAGHALDRGQWPRPLNVAADILHVGAAAVWIGGLLALAIALPRASRRLSAEQRPRFTAALVTRLSTIALVSVLVIAATGLVRALSELSAVSQLWSSGYGRALVVKTVFLMLVVAVGWFNRSRLAPKLRVDALRRNVALELVLLAAIVTAVAFLTDLAPGRQLARAIARPQTPQSIAAPPSGATVLAGESGDRAVGLAIRPGGNFQATVLGPNGGVDGLSLAFRAGGRTFGATSCGPGCYRAQEPVLASHVTVLLGSGAVRFSIPERTEPASGLVADARRAYAGLRSLVIHERLASNPRNKLTTTWRIVAPDRLTYDTSAGARAVVIGGKRWDGEGNGPLVPSAQSPLQLPGAQWGPIWLNARALGWRRVSGRQARVVSFFDPRLPGWFELAVDPRTHRPLELKMTTYAHFMHHRYTNFNQPMRIVPPQ